MQLMSAAQNYCICPYKGMLMFNFVDSFALRHYASLIQIQIAHCAYSMAPGGFQYVSIASGYIVNGWQLATDAT